MNSDLSPADDPIIPTGTVLFGEYEILSVLGGGGMGRVYSARHRTLDELRAIKTVRRGALTSKLEEALATEAKALIRLNHDAVVRCFELLRDDERIYLTMEHVDGPSLQRLLIRGPLPDDEVLALRQ